jgi:hypothetical protein
VDRPNDDLAADEVLVYVGSHAAGPDEDTSYEEQASVGRRAKEHGLEVVKIDDAELDRLRRQVHRIASRLESADEMRQGSDFGLESVTLHFGLSASGHFFFVASAEVEASLDITWTARK